MPRGNTRPKSEYGQQFAEKQGLKDIYGLREKQFRNYFKAGKDPDSIVQALESRLDNAVFRCGFAQTRKFARQLVSHGHMQVNGKNINSPSFRVKAGDNISIHPSSAAIAPFRDISMTLAKFEAPSWINLDKKALTAQITSEPKVYDPMIRASVKPTIEFYSR